MKITCQACQAKYTIADEKVVGKVVKIRCKKCGATIVVNGSESGAGASPPADAGSAGAAAFDYANAKGGGAPEPWTVNVNDGDQRTMTEPEVATAYRSGVINDETFCWKEGMSDWLPLAEIAALHSVCAAARAATSPPALGSEGEAPKARGRDGGGSVAPARPKTLPPAKDGNGASAAVAARRAGGRAPDNDLFGSAAKAGGEDEVLTSAPAGDKLTGARNENSVLFALNPLTDKGAPQPPAKMTATSEASGLIDIRQLSAQMRSNAGEEKKKNARVDDIMNLGGGTFSPTLAAPVLSAPSLDHISTPPPPSMLAAMGGGAQARNRALTFLAIGAGVFFVVASLLLVLVLVRGRVPAIVEDRERPSSSASAAELTATPSSTASAAASPTAPAPEGTKGAPESASASAPPAPSAKEAPAVPKETAPPPAPAVAAGPKPFGVPTAAKEAPAAPAGAAGAEPFNMGEARATLGGIASGVQSCKRGDTTGSGKVVVTFTPGGSVQSASVMSGSPFDGTLTAKCVEARFRAAHVPAFGGGPFPVTKSFNIN